ncbi:hypothetical protein [Altererythrobacter aquiaggeris]|uniref:hypothetical protein n=1 Tax=Aestuarierythrobacter aquiaggeris TaxID=1898396 RepID=UPI003018ECF6
MKSKPRVLMLALCASLSANLSACLGAYKPAAPAISGNGNPQAGEGLFRHEPPKASSSDDQALAFAQAACADCHAVEAPDLSPHPGAPSFAAVANRKGLTSETLSAYLRDAHNYPEAMDFDLDAPQVDALTRYILTLRDDGFAPAI